MTPRTFSQRYVEGLEELLVKANAAHIKLKDENLRLMRALETLQAKQQRQIDIYETFRAPEPPKVLEEVVRIQREQGRR